MRLVDLNLLLYAVNRDAPQHRAAHAWWQGRLQGDESIGLSWSVITGFLRITTNTRIFERPLSSERAMALVDSWLTHPNVEVVVPGPDHWRLLRALLHEAGTAGNLTTDAHLAALAIECGAELESTDADFARFRGLRWSNPLAAR